MKTIGLLQMPFQEFKPATENVHRSAIYMREPKRIDHLQELIM
jgi:hypothetical protein